MRSSKRQALSAPLICALASCALGPEPRSPSVEALGVPGDYAMAGPVAAMHDAGSPAPEYLAQWWAAFEDPVLTRFVERALAANTDVATAAARVRQARAGLVATRSALWPSLGVGASSAVRERSGDINVDTTSYNVGLDAAYEVDLFGGVRRSIEAANADLLATEASRQSVRIAVAAEAALAYLDARLAQRRLEIARSNLAAQDETLRIVQWRMMAGLVGALDLEQARRLRAQTAASVPLIEQGHAAAINRLSVLLAQTPAEVRALLEPPTPVPLASVPDVGIPADTLRRRPDVLAAEQALVAEIARIGVRQADLYPALRLTGSFGGVGTSLGNATDAAIASGVAALTAPIFEGGRLRAAVEQQRAAADAALASYRGTLLGAIEETENALVAVDVAARRERELLIALEAAQNAAALARYQYQTGLTDFQTLLDAERSLLATEDSAAAARADRSTAAVRLYKALGGGWDVAPLQQSAAAVPNSAKEPIR